MTTETNNWEPWPEVKARLEERWPALKSENLDVVKGDREAMLGLMLSRLGYARANAEEDLDEILAGRRIHPRDVADEVHHERGAA